MIDALLFTSPTPFSPFGVIAMWAIFAVALLAALRRRLDCDRERGASLHMLLAVVIVCRDCGPWPTDRRGDGNGVEGGPFAPGPRGDHKSHG